MTRGASLLSSPNDNNKITGVNNEEDSTASRQRGARADRLSVTENFVAQRRGHRGWRSAPHSIEQRAQRSAARRVREYTRYARSVA